MTTYSNMKALKIISELQSEELQTGSAMLVANEGTNSLHGGFHGYDKRMWETIEFDDRKVTFMLKSPSGDQGYPGNLELKVTYEVTDKNEIFATYRDKSDQDTLCNPTNHSFFNLSGGGKPEIENHILRIDADKYLPVDEKLLPEGKEIGRDINAEDAQLKLAGGYDHNYILNGNGDINKNVIEVCSPLSGISMKMSTTMPGIQFYAGNMLDNQTGKNNEVYKKRSGFALETQFYPDSIYHADYPSVVLKQGKEKEYVTRYTFSASK